MSEIFLLADSLASSFLLYALSDATPACQPHMYTLFWGIEWLRTVPVISDVAPALYCTPQDRQLVTLFDAVAAHEEESQTRPAWSREMTAQDVSALSIPSCWTAVAMESFVQCDGSSHQGLAGRKWHDDA